MERELARKRPATLVHTNVVPPKADALTLPRRDVLVAPLHRKQDLLRDVHRMVRRGEIGHTYKIRETPHGWAVAIVRIRERPRFPAWIWKASLAGTLALGFLAALAWVVKVLVAALLALLPVALGALVILAVLALLSGGGAITVTQIVKIKR